MLCSENVRLLQQHSAQCVLTYFSLRRVCQQYSNKQCYFGPLRVCVDYVGVLLSAGPGRSAAATTYAPRGGSFPLKLPSHTHTTDVFPPGYTCTTLSTDERGVCKTAPAQKFPKPTSVRPRRSSAPCLEYQTHRFWVFPRWILAIRCVMERCDRREGGKGGNRGKTDMCVPPSQFVYTY